ncbi:TetR family transcriptional regulator [Allostella humosa]|uniref:TetR family transcriptional regulator n=1 Tax=Stella humosa TaxID=94 RepID=UPI0011356F9A|nr:TetR family transcriptional regulator [Stella humosa]BBK33703.1 TetR family transcriptional regulator [Stella humosa]
MSIPVNQAARNGAAGHRSVRARHPEETRQRLLEAAWDEFSAKGLGGARVDAIARRAAANKRMIYHYFGSKAGLYLAVLELAYDRIRGHERALALEDCPPAEGIARLVAYNFDFCRDNPGFIHLLANENLHHARHLARSDKVRQVNLPVIDTIGRLLARGAAEGVFRPGIDPLDLYITIAALGYFYFSNIHTLSVVFGRDLALPDTVAVRSDLHVDLVLRYLRP